MTTTRRLPHDDTTRSSLTQDTVFVKFLAERLADARRDAERLQGEIDLLFAQIEGKRAEQAEYLRIVEMCDAGLDVTRRENRPAPELAPRQTDPALSQADPRAVPAQAIGDK